MFIGSGDPNLGGGGAELTTFLIGATVAEMTSITSNDMKNHLMVIDDQQDESTTSHDDH